MKIVKLPVEFKGNRVICECGCVFEFDFNDVEFGFEIKFDEKQNCIRRFKNKNEPFVECPFCGRDVDLKSVMVTE